MTDPKQATGLVNELIRLSEWVAEHGDNLPVERIHRAHDLIEAAWKHLEQRRGKR